MIDMEKIRDRGRVHALRGILKEYKTAVLETADAIQEVMPETANHLRDLVTYCDEMEGRTAPQPKNLIAPDGSKCPDIPVHKVTKIDGRNVVRCQKNVWWQAWAFIPHSCPICAEELSEEL